MSTSKKSLIIKASRDLCKTTANTWLDILLGIKPKYKKHSYKYLGRSEERISQSDWNGIECMTFICSNCGKLQHNYNLEQWGFNKESKT